MTLKNPAPRVNSGEKASIFSRMSMTENSVMNKWCDQRLRQLLLIGNYLRDIESLFRCKLERSCRTSTNFQIGDSTTGAVSIPE